MITSPPNFTAGPESNYSGVVPLGDPSEPEPVSPPAPRTAPGVRQAIAAGLAGAAAVAAVVSTLLPYEKFISASRVSSSDPIERPSYTVSLTSWGQNISPIPEDGWEPGSVALFGIPYSLAAVVLVVSAGLLLGMAGDRGYRIARLTVTAGAAAVLSMFAMMTANVTAFLGSGDSEAAMTTGITYESGPGIWGYLIVAVLGVAAAALALVPTEKTTVANMDTPPMGFPMPQQPVSQQPVQAPPPAQPEAPQVAEIPESPLNK